jgi:RNase P subunit RPR2
MYDNPLKAIIVCMRLSDKRSSPLDTTNLIVLQCEVCDENMWVSKNELDTLKKHSEYTRMMCGHCAVDLTYGVVETKQIDLSQFEEKLASIKA